MRYRISHATTYQYRPAVTDGYTLAYLLPRPTPEQTVESAEVVVEPVPDTRAEHVDVFGNLALQFGVHRRHDALSVRAISDVVVSRPGVPLPGPAWEDVAATVGELRGGEALTVRPFAAASPYVPLDLQSGALRAMAGETFTPGRPVIDATRDLCTLIYETFAYDPTFTDVSTPMSTILAARRGVCQDFAHVAAGCLRSVGLAARYVSGYLGTNGPRRQGAGASHAWSSVWVPDASSELGAWVDFDPTNDLLPADHHVTVAWGRDYGDVAPMRGVIIGPGSKQDLDVSVEITSEQPTSPL